MNNDHPGGPVAILRMAMGGSGGAEHLPPKTIPAAAAAVEGHFVDVRQYDTKNKR